MILYQFLFLALTATAQECEESWLSFNGHCYRHFYDPVNKVNYTEAQLQCKKYDSYLTEISSAEEFNFLAQRFTTNLRRDLEDDPLTGMVKDIYGNFNHARPEERWNKPYFKWCYDPPNNDAGKEFCVSLNLEYPTSQWRTPCMHDTYCAGGYSRGSYGYSRYICEKDSIQCKAPNTEVKNGKCVCKADLIDITETDVPERKKYKQGEKCVPKHPCNQIKDSLTVMFIVDSSESIKKDNWKALVEFLRMGADQLPSSANVGFVKYSENVTFANILPGGWTKEKFRKFVPTKYDNGATNTPAALDKARKLLKKDHNRNQVAVLITDGLPFMAEAEDKNKALKLTKKAAEKLHDADIPLVALGYGPSLQNEVENIKSWLLDEEDYFEFHKLACDLTETHMSILMQKVCRRFV